MRTINEILTAVSKNDVDVLNQITPTEVNMIDSDGLTILMNAVLEENIDPSVIRVLIARGADINASDPNDHFTALHFAARDQKERIVAILLDANAAVDPMDVYGNTPLWRAVMTADANLVIVKNLIVHGADPEKENNYGISPIDVVKDTGRNELMAVLNTVK